MIHYHGTPIGGGKDQAAKFLLGRHALVPHIRQDDLPAVAEFSASFVFDNSAFTQWKGGNPMDTEGYIRWCEKWHRHPGLDFCLIPDVIDGSEIDNDAMLRDWPSHLRNKGLPIWHLHEDVERLSRLVKEWPVVALGSSGQWPTPGTESWWYRMHEAMMYACDPDGRPLARLHGLRMMNPKIFTRLPLSSADSVNAAVNCGSTSRFGMYLPATASQRAAVIADRVERFNSASVWIPWIRDAVA